MDEVAPKGVAAGERYSEAGMRAINGWYKQREA
jgi:hypothetical protein